MRRYRLPVVLTRLKACIKTLTPCIPLGKGKKSGGLQTPTRGGNIPSGLPLSSPPKGLYNTAPSVVYAK